MVIALYASQAEHTRASIGIKPEEHDLLSVPSVLEESASLYEHCVRALDRGRRLIGNALRRSDTVYRLVARLKATR